MAEVGPEGGRKVKSFSFSTFYAKKRIVGSLGLEVQKECVSSYRLKQKEKLQIDREQLLARFTLRLSDL